MSSIERAMDKILEGEEGRENVSTSPAPSVAVPEAATAPASAAQEATATSEPAASMPAATPPEPSVAAAPPAAAPAARPAAPSRPAGDRVVDLDFTRLAAGGFLTPNQATTRQSEEYQQIKRRLLNNIAAGTQNESRRSNLILITSSVPSEGKTFTSVNLAISIAMEVDHTVLLIDTDIMKRDTSRVLGVSDRKGPCSTCWRILNCGSRICWSAPA